MQMFYVQIPSWYLLISKYYDVSSIIKQWLLNTKHMVLKLHLDCIPNVHMQSLVAIILWSNVGMDNILLNTLCNSVLYEGLEPTCQAINIANS